MVTELPIHEHMKLLQMFQKKKKNDLSHDVTFKQCYETLMKTHENS